MNDLRQLFIDTCKVKYTQYGFMARGNHFMRVINDVQQHFYLQRSVYGNACIVNFGITPLCCRMDDNSIKRKDIFGSSHYVLGKFKDSTTWWEHDSNSQGIKKCVDDLISNIDEYLMPFFIRGDNCITAYDEVCNLEKRNGSYGYAIQMFDYLKYLMAVKMENYNLALLHIKACKEQCEDAYNANKLNLEQNRDVLGSEMDPKYEAGIRNRLKEYDEIIDMIANRQYEKIQQIIIEDEKFTLSHIPSRYIVKSQ